MQITADNYEIYYLDYLEGNLDQSVVPEFEAFLDANPNLTHYFQPDTIKLVYSEQIAFPDKQALKKFEFDKTSVSKYTFEEFSIAYFEGLITNTKQKEFFDFIKINPEYTLEFDLYRKSYLISQQKLIFTNKKDLYHSDSNHRLFSLFKVASLAAGIALLFGIYVRSPQTIKSKINTNTSSEKYQTSNQIAVKSIVKTSPLTGTLVAKRFFNKINNNVVQHSTLSNSSSQVEKLKTTLPEKDTTHIAYLKAKSTLISSLNPEIEAFKIQLNPNIPYNQTENAKGITENALLQIRKNLGLEKNETPKGRLTFFKILQAGVKGFNELTESNMQLTELTDESGKMTAMSFKTESGIFQIHHIKKR